ncbi:MAG: hypothetical protein HRU70_05570 [Phycisphaeraceae bacterium]|nr:MAG: hypothetical protein HRU70_05570 [Phycisphaeraceae bacterium]
MASSKSSFRVFASGLVLGVVCGAVAGAYLSGRFPSPLDTTPAKAGAGQSLNRSAERDPEPTSQDTKDEPTVIDQGSTPAPTPAAPATDPGTGGGTPLSPQTPAPEAAPATLPDPAARPATNPGVPPRPVLDPK